VGYCCGWDSNGFGKNRGFELIELLLVCHGGRHNDTIVTVERKVNTTLGDSNNRHHRFLFRLSARHDHTDKCGRIIYHPARNSANFVWLATRGEYK